MHREVLGDKNASYCHECDRSRYSCECPATISRPYTSLNINKLTLTTVSHKTYLPICRVAERGESIAERVQSHHVKQEVHWGCIIAIVVVLDAALIAMLIVVLINSGDDSDVCVGWWGWGEKGQGERNKKKLHKKGREGERVKECEPHKR